MIETVATLATSPGPDYLRFLGRLHPLVVHFPVALILVAVVFEIPTILRRNAAGGGHSAFAHRCVVLGALGAAVAAWFGWINADHESHGRALENTIFWHRWLGVATAVLALVVMTLPFFNRSGTRQWASRLYRVGLIVCAGTLAVGGHLGGEIVFGQGYVLEVLRTPAPTAEPADGTTEPGDSDPAAPVVTTEPVDDGRITFVTHIRPIFDEACFRCHGPDKAKAGLRLHTREAVFGPEREWWVVEPGDVEGSLLYELVALPADDPDRMPGEGDALSTEELELIAEWIRSGAEWGVGDAVAAGPSAEPAADPPATPSGSPDDEPLASPELPDPESVDEAAVSGAVARVQELGGVASPIAIGVDAIDVSFSVVGADAGDDAIAALAGLEPVLAWLDVGRTSVTDEGVARLGPFRELRRLHLERTEITDACMDDLAGFVHLRYLNLYGTKVTDAAIEPLASMDNLEQVYLWDTGVTDDGLARLAALRPDLSVVGALDLPSLGETALQIKGTPAPCCAEAAAAGAPCAHECCIAAAADGKVCEKCGGVPAG